MSHATTQAADTAVDDRPWEQLSELEEYRLLLQSRLDHVVPVREPLVLVSQIQRSGGTLLSQLFDGHPECHAHPEELKIGHPRKIHWPRLDLARPDTWFELLFEDSTVDLAGGYHRRSRPELDHDVFAFLFSRRLQKRIFDRAIESADVAGERDVLDCYFTSYFNAWLDNHELYTGPKKVVTGFVPRLAMDPANVERFFAAYPDGTLITVVRDPRGWYASASTHKREKYGDVDEAMRLWRASAESSVDARERFGDRVLVLTYERLVHDTERVMRDVASAIGIEMSPSLLVPTFNHLPIRADSSYAVGQYGVLTDRTAVYRERLDGDTIARVEQLAGDVYERADAVALR